MCGKAAYSHSPPPPIQSKDKQLSPANLPSMVELSFYSDKNITVSEMKLL